MKKLFTNILANPIVKTIGRITDHAVLGGAIGNLKEDTPDNPKGKVDWIKLAGALIPIGLLILLGLGIITVDQVLELAGIGE